MSIETDNMTKLIKENYELSDYELAQIYVKKYKTKNKALDTIRRKFAFAREFLGLPKSKKKINKEQRVKTIKKYIELKKKYKDKELKEYAAKIQHYVPLKFSTIYRMIREYEKYGIY